MLKAVAWVWLLLVAVLLGLLLIVCVYAFLKSAPGVFILIAVLVAASYLTDWAYQKVVA